MLAGPIGKANGQIQIGLGKIDFSIRRYQRELQVRIGRTIMGKPRCQPFGGKITRRSNRQIIGCLPRLHRPHRFLKLQETGAQGIQPLFRLLSQF